MKATTPESKMSRPNQLPTPMKVQPPSPIGVVGRAISAKDLFKDAQAKASQREAEAASLGPEERAAREQKGLQAIAALMKNGGGGLFATVTQSRSPRG
jgi:hypothetical protein